MSRTKNLTKYDFQKADCNYEFPQGYKAPYKEFKPGDEYHVDPSGTTNSDYRDPWLQCTRHPNKKRRTNSLSKEFHTTDTPNPKNWKNRFGDAYDKSSRDHLVRYEMAKIRRTRLKEQTRKLINEELYL